MDGKTTNGRTRTEGPGSRLPVWFEWVVAFVVIGGLFLASVLAGLHMSAE